MYKKTNFILSIALLSLMQTVSSAPEREGTAPAPLTDPNYTRVYPDTPRAIKTFFRPNQGSIAENIISGNSAIELAEALGIPTDQILSSSIGTSAPSAVGISDTALGNYFPTKGNTFVILSSGEATTASTANDSGSTTTVLDGLNNSLGTDMTQWELELNPPNEAQCVSFDFAFYSEEFPEFVGTSFNDVFTAEYLTPGQSSTITVGEDHAVSAPYNFAFDADNNIISVNTVFGVTAETATTYDGATPRLRAFQQINSDSPVRLVFTIQDIGDSAYDSSVFLDNFAWGAGDNCETGALVDTDNDGLLDDWEINGVDIDDDGSIDLDLPAMGADPNRKDLFVEIDYMVKKLADGSIAHTHAPQAAAIKKIVDAFSAKGIALHVDAGPDSIMNSGTGATWGSLSQANAIDEVKNLGTCSGNSYNWDAFSSLKNSNFSSERAKIFRYNIWAHQLCTQFGSTSGVARGIPESDFLVSLGTWGGVNGNGTVNQQAGTFMHELGHTLGLKHGGVDHVNFKPNYLSVMNYWFQTGGLIKNGQAGTFSFSELTLPELDETNLNETVGLSAPEGASQWGTRFACGQGGTQQFVTSIHDGGVSSLPIDWNCDNDPTDTGVVKDINNPQQNTVTSLSVLKGGQEEWPNLKFAAGSVGGLGQIITAPEASEVMDIETSEDEALEKQYAVLIVADQGVALSPGSSETVNFVVKNLGEEDLSLALEMESGNDWANIQSVPTSIDLGVGSQASIALTVNIPESSSLGVTEVLKLTATQLPIVDGSVTDTGEIVVTVSDIVLEPGDSDGDGNLNVLDIIALINQVFNNSHSYGSNDCNNDGNVNVLDVICNINKVFPIDEN